ncbi:hypothetical protein ACFOW4_07815 [Micromonospora sp. GCM10011542]|uniref:hypothetical protein n=1 Tax=Micromonospora sp. GCM10011542 TaxID=3317337 RepID=UPI0036096F32
MTQWATAAPRRPGRVLPTTTPIRSGSDAATAAALDRLAGRRPGQLRAVAG